MAVRQTDDGGVVMLYDVVDKLWGYHKQREGRQVWVGYECGIIRAKRSIRIYIEQAQRK